MEIGREDKKERERGGVKLGEEIRKRERERVGEGGGKL